MVPRNPLLSALFASVSLALILGTTVSTYFAFRATRGEKLAVRKAQEALDNAHRADVATQAARDEKQLSDHSLYLAEMRLAHQAWQEGLVDLVQQYLQNQVPKRSEDPDRRGFEWYYLARLCESDLRTLRGHKDMVRRVIFHRDGDRMISASDDNTLKFWDTSTGQEVRTLRGHTDFILDVAFSPDFTTLASASEDHTVKLWSFASGQEVRTLRGHASGVNGVSFSSDGRFLASASDDETVKLWDVGTGQEVSAPCEVMPARSMVCHTVPTGDSSPPRPMITR